LADHIIFVFLLVILVKKWKQCKIH